MRFDLIRGSLFAIGAAALGVIQVGHAVAPSVITLPADRAYPESLSSSTDGTLYVGSAAMGGIQRIQPGESAPQSWIAPGTFGTRSTFGVLVDEHAGLVWTCSNDLTGAGIPSPGSGDGSYLKGFSLTTGAVTVSARLPGKAFCNDIAVSKDGDVYVTDENQATILRLDRASQTLRVFARDPK